VREKAIQRLMQKCTGQQPKLLVREVLHSSISCTAHQEAHYPVNIKKHKNSHL